MFFVVHLLICQRCNRTALFRVVNQVQEQISQIRKILFKLLYKAAGMETKVAGDAAQDNQRFVKGMSLEQYMAGINLGSTQPELTIQDISEENLFQSSVDHPPEGIRPKKSQYFINEIDEQSAEDSVQCRNHQHYQFTQENPRQPTKKTVVFNNQLHQLTFRPKVSTISMNETAYPKRLSNDKVRFRPKQMSMSPYNRKLESAMQNGSITLYGSKFGQAAGKQASRIPQLVTFYGKIQHQKQEPLPKQGIFKKTDSLRNFKKNNHLQIEKLIEFQNKIKSNYVQSGNHQNKRADNVKEKGRERKGRL